MTLPTVQQMEVPCGSCGKTIIVELVPPRIVNTPETSLCVVVHDAIQDCPHCRKPQGIMLAGVQGYIFRAVPVKPNTQVYTADNSKPDFNFFREGP